MNIHPVFHISLLEPILLEVLLAPITKIELVNPNMKYKVEKILDYKRVRNYIKYLVKYIGVARCRFMIAEQYKGFMTWLY
jgi:hypothetical protein